MLEPLDHRKDLGEALSEGLEQQARIAYSESLQPPLLSSIFVIERGCLQSLLFEGRYRLLWAFAWTHCSKVVDQTGILH